MEQLDAHVATAHATLGWESGGCAVLHVNARFGRSDRWYPRGHERYVGIVAHVFEIARFDEAVDVIIDL
jgi:hypothetical protein